MELSPLDRLYRIGTLAGKGRHTADYVRQLVPLGFESFQINFWQHLDGVELPSLAGELRSVLKGTDAVVSSLAVFGNPLGAAEIDATTRRAWELAIDHAQDFGTDLVCGFAGRVTGKPVPESIEMFKRVFGPLAERAATKRVRIAFENCPMGGNWSSGDWNIAFCPDAWNLMFEAVPAPNLGLEWEPCHQLGQLIDPLPQLREWVKRVFHIHGKDATVHRDIIARRGIACASEWVHHRHPGFGDTNWTDLISILRMGGYQGTIDIEGWHDPVYRGDLEMTGQVHALHHLRRCRGGSFVPNPSHCV
jgi:sugar phosphate isomerase/epimerase